MKKRTFDMEQIPVSKNLNKTVKAAFEEIEEDRHNLKMMKKTYNILWIVAASVVTVFCITGFFTLNPTMAEKLPGGILLAEGTIFCSGGGPMKIF